MLVIKSRLDDQEIKIDVQPNTNYGVLLSGGIDSAVMLYLIIKAFKEANIELNLKIFVIEKSDGSYMYVEDIINWINERCGVSLPSAIAVGDGTIVNSMINRSALKDIFENKFKDINYVFIGLNQNPPAPFKMPGNYPPRPHNMPLPNRSPMPFLNLYKTHIIDLVFEHELEELFDLTHSCTEQRIGRCNFCFQCNERIWAFRQLGYRDTGKR
jgi:hypothetical protein